MLHKNRQRLANTIGKRFGFLFLVLVLLVITAGIIKPGFYFLGWDNFSSYLNPANNIFKTLFATWRDHRGLGVPSDAEVNDIPRQLFCLLASLFVPKELVDQLYMVLMLWGGVLGMYALGRKVSNKLFQSAKKQELFGFLASFFYLFNLNTLTVFYFPMIMYNSRFFMLPITTFVLLNLINRPQISVYTYVFYLIILFIGFGSYMVPTIFIVTMIMFLFMFLVFKKTKRLIITLIFYLLLGMYWLLPFVNYVKQKAAIVLQTPTFIEVNEAMFNKPKSYYSFERQAKLRPDFFGSKFSNHETDLDQPFHELADQSEKGLVSWVLWIFPILYLLGLAYVFLFKRRPILVWFAITTLVFLILSMKEYSPLGFFYNFISDNIPFADTIFRFGDTKFHPMVAFGGSIISAFFLVQMLHSIIKMIHVRFVKYLIYSSVFVFIFLHLFAYKSYFTGNFIGFFMYNKIPTPYFEIAKIINQDPEAIRVIHLPFDNHSYWKPYGWGYFGSSFLHFMLEKPLFDRSFEPASMENAAVHKKVTDLLHLAFSVSEESKLQERALDLYHLLRSLSIKYIIDDQTISTNIEARNISYWGTINSIGSHHLLAYLEKKGYLKLVKQYHVSPQDYSKDYAKLYPYNKKQSNSTFSSYNIQLYELLDIAPRIQFLSEVDKVHTAHELLLSPKVKRSLGHHFIQSKEFDNQSLIFPFVSIKSKLETENNQINIFPSINLGPGTYFFESKTNASVFPTRIINIYTKKINKSIMVYFENLMLPTVEGASYQDQKIVATIELKTERDDYIFINIGGVVLPLKNNNDGEREFVGSIMIRSDFVPVSLLFPYETYDISSHLVQHEPDPQCLHDGFDNAESHITGDNGILKIWGQNVSNCLTTEVLPTSVKDYKNTLVSFWKLEFDIEGTAYGFTPKRDIDGGKPLLNQKIAKLDNPLIVQVCIKPEGATECLNKGTLFRVTKTKQRYTTSFVGDLTGIDKLLVTFIIRNGQRQKYETTTTNILLKTYISSKPENLSIERSDQYSHQFKLDDSKEIYLTAPIAVSDYSQFIDLKDGGVLFRHDEECDKQGKTQGIKENNKGLLSYLVGCRNFVQKSISFSSDSYYLWLTKYKHFSGAMPAFIIMDKLNEYYFSKLLPNDVVADDYFSIPLQGPESILTDEMKITDAIDNAPLYTVSGYLEPRFDLRDNGNKELIIQHHSQNEGLVELDNVLFIELPNYWSNSRIRPAIYKTEKFETQGQSISSKQILPSLWQVKTNTQEGEFMVFFNEQYDNQWMIFGVPTLLHARCDGYANCYKIKVYSGFSTFYLFYIPEVLNLIGFTISIMTIMGGLFYYSKRNVRFHVSLLSFLNILAFSYSLSCLLS